MIAWIGKALSNIGSWIMNGGWIPVCIVIGIVTIIILAYVISKIISESR